jgi:hypothetical protein
MKMNMDQFNHEEFISKVQKDYIEIKKRLYKKNITMKDRLNEMRLMYPGFLEEE